MNSNIGGTRRGAVWMYLAVFLVTGGTACSSCRGDASKPVPPVAPAVDTATKEALSPLARGNSLVGQLADEAAARPAETVHAEQIVERLARDGIMLGNSQQSVARTHGASYCVNTRNESLYLLICEYKTTADLETGRKLSEAIFSSVPHHSFHTVKTTQVMVQALNDAAVPAAERAVTSLSSL